MKYLQLYINAFKGLSREIWLLAFITFVNRAGTMVIPFLAIYLNEALGFTKSNIAWVMSIFGLGSVVGSWIGGKLADKVGYYKIMLFSLFGTGLAFFALQYCKSFISFSVGIFVLMVIADCYRPASMAAIRVYSKPANRTRSLSLIRLAINLGVSFGPAAAGIIIASFGYLSLFWIDAVTCILASLIFVLTLSAKQSILKATNDEIENEISRDVPPYKDGLFITFSFVLFLFVFMFFQLFTTLPLFYREDLALSEITIGWLLALNGIVIVLFEMQLVQGVEHAKKSTISIINIALILTAMSYIVLICSDYAVVLVISMVWLTLGEMLAFPFSNTLAMNWAPQHRTGEYMGFYTTTISLALIVAPNLGLQIVDLYGYNALWVVLGVIGLIAMLVNIQLGKRIAKRADANLE